MARKPMSEEQKNAARERLAAARAKKAENQQAKQTTPETKAEPTSSPEPTVTITQAQLDKFISLLEQTQVANANATPQQKLETQAELEGMTVGVDGMRGTMYKYPVEHDYYPDPSERILNMPELTRFAPHENYEIFWKVEGSFYENERTHIYYAEPRFEITILRIMYDEFGQKSNRRAIVGRNILHEDEVVANMVIRTMGIPAESKKQVLDEARFERIRRWVLDLLVPTYRQADRVENIGEMVVDGKVVPYIEVETNADKSINPGLDVNKLS